MLLLTNQLLDLFKCLSLIVFVPNRRPASIVLLRDLLVQGSLPESSTVHCRSLYMSGTRKRAFFETSFQ